MSSLGEEFPKEQARCREILSVYQEIGPPGAFAYAELSKLLDRANTVVMSGDLVAMIQCYEEMKEWKE